MRIPLLANFWLKLSAIVLALLVWLHVATERQYSNDMSLPLVGASLREGLTLVSPVNERLTITVRATGKELLRARIRENALRLNLTQFRTGPHVVELAPELLSFVEDPHGLVITRVISPSMLSIEVAERVTRSLPIAADIVLDTTSEFQLAGVVHLSPTRVTVTGPAPLLDTPQAILTEPIPLASVSDSLRRTVSFKRPEYRNLRLMPDSAEVSFRVEPVKRRLFPRLTIALVHATESDGRIEPTTLDIELEGGEQKIANVSERQINVVADRRNQNVASGLIPLRIDVPKGTRVRARSADSVRLVLPGGS